MKLTINGKTLTEQEIPRLFVAYVAALRARHYAEVDAARDGADFDTVFTREFGSTLRDEEEVLDWLNNNINLPKVKAGEVEVSDIHA